MPEPVVDGQRTPRGQIVMAYDISQFASVSEFKAKVDRAIDQAKAARLKEGVTEILMPGERGFREEERRRREGIPIHEKVWRDFCELARGRGVDAEASLS